MRGSRRGWNAAVPSVSGSTARKALGKDEVAVDAAIVGIIDSVELEREKNGK